tara:strand:+ start:29 stop:535 length:507 start_codon:yes stop_codon:yes gene_type:complete
MISVKRYFLELKVKNKKDFILDKSKDYVFIKNSNSDYNLNKFFYRHVGAEHYWRDRLIWSDNQWSKYVSNPNFETWILKKNDDLIGFYEQEFHASTDEVELINMGILKEFRDKKLGSLLLLHSINTAFQKNIHRMWVHTCSLDHKNALKNYMSKGFKIFKEEEIDFVA